METLRDYQDVLAIPNIDRGQTPAEETVVAIASPKKMSMKNGIDGTLLDASEEKSKTPVEIVNDRFNPDFTDPLYIEKPIAYSKPKRAFDLIFSAFVLMLVWPVMAIAALAVKVSSPGPVVFRQIRVGKGGRYFVCYKFRSMCVDAEYQKKQLMHLNEANGPVFKIKRDPRITPVGAFIRKFSIDELPQLFNVLRGEMSVVGPRPPIPAEVEQYTPLQRGRLAVKPGLTCLWQVSGRSNLSFEKWVELDLSYIQTMSFWNDLVIVLKTIPAVLMGSGAH